MDQTANMLGALSITLADEVWQAVNTDFDSTGEIGAAVVLLGAEPLSITQLAGALSLTHSGGVRLVDRLVSAGLAQRQPHPKDSRSVLVALTDRGRVRHKHLLSERAKVLEPAIEALNATERATLQRALRKMLTRLVVTPLASMQICRLCDEASCVARGCPVEDRYQEIAVAQ